MKEIKTEKEIKRTKGSVENINDSNLKMAWERHQRDGESNKIEQARRNIEALTRLIGLMSNESLTDYADCGEIKKSLGLNIKIINKIQELK